MKKLNLFSNLWRLFRGSQKDESRTRLRLVFDSFTCRLRVCPLKIVAVLAILLTIGVGNAWADYTITFKTSGTTSLINTGGTYATSTETAYVSGTASGVQFGSNSKGGNIVLTMTASGQIQASKIVLNGYYKPGSKGGNCKCTFTYTDDSSTNTTVTATTSATNTDVATDATKTLKSIKLESTGSEKKFYITGVKVVAAGASTCETPTFSPAAGTYITTQSVTISSETAGATIYYTTDGSTPTTSSSVYSSAISVSSTQTIKALAVKDGMTNSEIASATYTIADCDWLESFDGCSGTGGNDGSWSGTIASTTYADATMADNHTWTLTNGNAANKCIKLGTGDKQGSATTPTLTGLTGTLTLKFRAAAWNGNSEQTTLNLSTSNGTFSTTSESSSTVSLTKGAWTNYSVTINSVTSAPQITFQGYQASNSRFFLDSICVSATPLSCSNYSFHFGATANADGKNITDQTVECFTQVGSSTEWQLADFTIPTTTQYYFVGYAGYFYDSNIGPSGASNSGSERNQFKYLPVANLQGSSCSGSGDSYKHAAAGAHGKIRIYSDNSGKNIYAGFIPSGYQMRYGTNGGSDWANIQLTQVSSSAVWKSAVMDLTAAMVAKRYYVNVWTSGSYAADDEGVAINNWTNGGSAISSMKRKTNNGDYWADGVSDGMRGFFRTWTDNCADNGYMHFVPTHRIIYHANYPVGDSPADTYSVDVSVEETNSSISLASAPSAPDGYTFLGWFTAASGGTQRTGTQTISAGASADVELYAHWEHVPVITVSETSCAFGDRKVNGGPYTMKFNVSGSYLKGNISLAVSGTNAAMFDVTPATLTPTTGTVSSTEITVSYSPTGAGAHTAQIDITSSSATSKTVDLTGTGKWEVIWNVSGSDPVPSLIADNSKPIFPSTPTSCESGEGASTTFIGWTKKTWTGKKAKSYIDALTGDDVVHTSNSTMANITANGTNYYAVFAKETEAIEADKYVRITDGTGFEEGEKIIIVENANDHMLASDFTGGSGTGSSSEITVTDSKYVWTVGADNGYGYHQLTSGNVTLSAAGAVSNSTKYQYIQDSEDPTDDDYSWWALDAAMSTTNCYALYNDWGDDDSDGYADWVSYIEWYNSGSKWQSYYVTNFDNETYFALKLYKQKRTVSFSNYITTCCDKLVTLSDGSPTNGTITFDPEGPIETCSNDKEVTMTITPDPGYYLSNYTSSGVSTSNSPSIATSGSASGTEQSVSLTFAQNTTTGTYTAAATFTAKPVSNWTWKYNDEAVPDPLHLYVNEVKQLDVTWEPEDLLDDQKGYSVTKESSIAENSKQPSYYRFHGSAGVTSLTNTSISFSLAGLTTKVVNVTVEPLPVVQFVDIIHNESFDNVVATASAGVVTFEKQTPTHDDFTGEYANGCEEDHLHLVGWIYSEWSGAANYMNGTSAAPNKAALTAAKVGTADGFAEDNTPCFFEPGATINTETWKGKTFYAVWGKLTE